MKIAVIIPTKNAGADFSRVLKKLQGQRLRPDELTIYDSASTDDTVLLARSMGVNVIPVAPADFNHGATRELARKQTAAEIVIFMTQDAIPVDDFLIERLVEPILDGRASFSYARQIPRQGADIFESFPRHFNYPAESQIRSIADAEKYGVYTFFSSDSCAAYRNSALDEIGGFRPTLTSEDYFAAARLLCKGHKVAYAAGAVVEHSHAYTLLEEFRRYFDTGYVRAENPWVQAIVGQAEGRGKEYFSALVHALSARMPWLVPYAAVNTCIKLLGYRLGYRSLTAPVWWKKKLSIQRYYWDSRYYRPGVRTETDRNEL